MQPKKERGPGLREQLPELRAREHVGQDPSPLNGEFKLLGELRRSFVAGASGQRDISSRGFSSSGDFNSSKGFGSSGGFSSIDKYSLLTNFGSSI
jgi:hypothetical protein